MSIYQTNLIYTEVSYSRLITSPMYKSSDSVADSVQWWTENVGNKVLLLKTQEKVNNTNKKIFYVELYLSLDRRTESPIIVENSSAVRDSLSSNCKINYETLKILGKIQMWTWIATSHHLRYYCQWWSCLMKRQMSN